MAVKCFSFRLQSQSLQSSRMPPASPRRFSKTAPVSDSTSKESSPCLTHEAHGSADDILSGKCDSRLIQTTGIVREVFKDEIDPRWLYMILNCDGSRIPVVFISETDDISKFTSLIDAKISVSGFCAPKTYGIRQLLGWHISCIGPAAINVLSPAASDPFTVPEINNRTPISPVEVVQMGRRRMSGRIVAVAMAKSKRPDVVIMDLMMPRIDGAEATRLICDAVPETKVLILTSYATSADIVRAIDAGAAHQGGLLETWRFQPHRSCRNRPSQASPQDLMNLSNLRLL